MVANFVGSLLLCPSCKLRLPPTSFYKSSASGKGRQCWCISCKAKRECTLEGALARLRHTCRVQAKARAKRGRGLAGICTLTIAQLRTIYERQNGCCYWFPTKKLSFVPHTSWRISIDRLDPCKGYTFDNVVMCAAEFNTGRTWSWSKVLRMLALRFSVFNLAAFDAAIKPAFRGAGKGCPHREAGLPKDGRACKLCGNAKSAAAVRRPRGFLSNMLSAMRQQSRIAGLPEVEHTHDDMVRLARMQIGRCVLSGLPQVFSTGAEFQASPMRIDATRGFALDNVAFVVLEFNVSRNRRKSAPFAHIKDELGWTKEKVDEWLTWLDSPEGRAHVEQMAAREAASKEDKEEQKEEV